MLRWTLAATHLLALGIGLGAVWARGRALAGPLDRDNLRRIFAADTWWGLAGGLWLVTGLWRLLAGTEKATSYYMANHLFWTKMALFVAILLLEIGPIIGITRWRRAMAAGREPDIRNAGRLRTVSNIETALIIAIVILATGMARGYGSA
jgi:putative membrane protein